jgi:hypothetical protein
MGSAEAEISPKERAVTTVTALTSVRLSRFMSDLVAWVEAI